MKKINLLFVLFAVLLGVSCSDSDKTLPNAPTIEFDTPSGEFKVKVGKSVDIKVNVTDAINPSYSWKLDSKIVSTESLFSFEGKKIGEYFLFLRVDAENGYAEDQVKVTVLDKLAPEITMATTSIAFAGIDFIFEPIIEYTDETTKYTWMLNGTTVSDQENYVFNGTVIGDNEIILKVSNEDGESIHISTLTVLPVAVAEVYFSDGSYITEENKDREIKYSVPLGKKIVLAPIVSNASENATFSWTVDGAENGKATKDIYSFEPKAKGQYAVSVIMKDGDITSTATALVECVDPEGTFYRPSKEGDLAYGNHCFEFTPAPGQFVDFQAGSTAEQARKSVHSKLGTETTYIESLGAFGGYVVIGFDHSVDNIKDKYDIHWKGNAFAGWSEPGIIWVMQDENGNGLPDDTWYQLKGSETGAKGTAERYAITYHKPTSPASDVMWTDSKGQVGSVDYLGQYHPQAYYYPMFINSDSYTLTGTLLRSTFSGGNGEIETTAGFDWGYVDNIGKGETAENSHLFKIDNAIHADGTPANLKYIDFVKVHTGMLGKGALVGEVSTEFNSPYDNHLKNK